MRVFGLRLLFAFAAIIAIGFLPLPIFIFFRSLIRGARSFHPRGTLCRAELTGTLAGAARVRLSGVSAPENSPEKTVIGLAIKLGDDQDLVFASFEAFLQTAAGVAKTDVTDYLANQYASVSPWHTAALGVIWLRAIPAASSIVKTGTRVERLDADIAAGRARFTLEARSGPGPDGAVIGTLAEVTLLERLATDDPSFHISMFRTGRGVAPTGFRNGIRAIVYPISQFARGLRHG